MKETLKPASVARHRHVCGARAAILCLALAALTHASAALAQNEDKVKAGVALWRGSGCSDCHGPFANGEKERDESPTGADLRTSRLDAAALKLAITCGRPGTGMPAFDEGASAARGCSSVSEFPAPRKLSPDEIDAIVAYLQARILGHGRITKAECLLYYTDRPEWYEDYN